NNVMTPLESGILMSYDVNDTLSTEHGFMLKEASEVMIQFGNFRLAKKYLNGGKRAFEASGNLVDDIKAEIDVMEAQILVGKGFNQEAIKLVKDNLDFYNQRAISGEGDKRQQEEKKVEYAELLTVLAEAYANMGDVDEASKLFYDNKEWIKDNLKKSHILYGWNTFLDTEMMSQNGLSLDAQASAYEDAFNEGRKKYEETHWMVLLMNERLMSALYRNEQKGKFNIVENMYKGAIKEFDRNSMHYLARERMDLELDLLEGDLKKLETGVNELLINPIVPKFHKSRIELLEFAKLAGLLTGKHKNVEGYNEQILAIQAELLGTEAPDYHLTKLQLANYYIDYTDKIQDAKAIYDYSFHEVVEKEITRKHPDYITILNHLAVFYEATDDYKMASKFLEDALLASREKYENVDMAYGLELDKIAGLQIKIGQYKKAQENIDLAIEILEDKKETEARSYYASALITLAKLQSIKGQFDEADDNLYASEKIQSLTAPTLASTGLDQLDDKASLYINVGRYSDADDLLKKSLADKKKQFGPQSRHLNETLILSSKLRLVKGDYTEAEKLARQANNITLSIFGESSTKVVPSMLALANVLTVIGDYQKAERLLQQAIKIQTERFGPDHVDVGKSTSQLALVNFYDGKPIELVQKRFAEAEKIIGASLGGSNPTYAEILKNMAVANIAAGNYSLANQYLDQANRIWSSKVGRRNNVNAATISLLKGDINYRQRRYSQAENLYGDALKQFERVFSTTHPEYVKVQS
ncbi:MAG: tetratricopeptide repeat protein, partial [Cyclobacteriaceae bacterium]